MKCDFGVGECEADPAVYFKCCLNMSGNPLLVRCLNHSSLELLHHELFESISYDEYVVREVIDK